MSDLIAIAYDDKYRADEVRNKLLSLEKGHLVDLEDALVIVRNEKGKIKLHQMHNLTAEGAMRGGWWGLLIGIIFSIPFIGPGAAVLPFVSTLVGAGGGALTGSAMDIGVDDDFARACAERLRNGTSALFVLVRRATPDKVIDEVKPYGGHILTTSLSKESEAKLRELLEPLRAKVSPGDSPQDQQAQL